MITIQSCKYNLKFKFEAGTSRGTMNDRDSWYVMITNTDTGVQGIGECAPLPGLSIEDQSLFDNNLKTICVKIQSQSREQGILTDLLRWIEPQYPAIKMGFETAILDYIHGGKKMIFDNGFFSGEQKIPINGLVWMGDREFMLTQIHQKIKEGYSCIKMKIGAIDFETELELLKYIRSSFGAHELVLRVDANGAFRPEEVMKVLEKLAKLEIHSIEQPVMPKFEKELAGLSKYSPIPVALDESLIGKSMEKDNLLDRIHPSYIVLKPTLLGGFAETAGWIQAAESRNIGWWITSALESNIGLNAICQFTAQYQILMEQGLGTGQLYLNNFHSPIHLHQGMIQYSGNGAWELDPLMAAFG